ncbi:MAG: LPS export ABC transporter periplasmic protein LptC [Phascolarctobacterium sp.]|nr:LPS export ABC transporter periplasmic protein LptC [Phascolarctobacterium sp.]
MNKKTLIAVGAAVVFAGAIICWLIFGGTVKVPAGKGVTATVNSTMKNTTLTRESEGKKLWEFTVGEADTDKDRNKVILKGITGKVYRKDGSSINVVADRGIIVANKNDFTLEGKVKFTDSNGAELTTDKINYKQDQETITATGHVLMTKDDYRASADLATTTTSLENVKLKGHAKVEKGGK